jgi:hypothetical protein
MGGNARARRQEIHPPARVEVKQVGGRWQLLREGKPYFIRGAGGSDKLDLLKVCGGNSIRTWGAETAGRDLERARRNGLTMTLGLWLGHKEHNFKYDDPKMVADQLAKMRADVLDYRGHPNLLIWGIGNEMEGDGKDPNVWRAVEEIAKMIKQLDPNHPTMTVTAEIGEGGIKAREVARLCPSIDILGVNSYGGAGSVADRLKKAGWTKPYIVTEFGPPGPWEVGKTSWGAALEPDSTQKAIRYRDHYRAAVESQAGWSLGSYVFLWGDKVESTPTWFGMFLPGTGDRLGPVDAMTRLWSGKDPAVPVPDLMRWESAVGGKEVPPGSQHTTTIEARGVSGARLTYRLEIRPELSGPARPEPGQVAPEAVRGSVPPESPDSRLTFTVPEKEGAYRLYLYIRDGKGGAATANAPFLVKR